MEDGLLIKLAVGAVVPGAVGGVALLLAWWRHPGRGDVQAAGSPSPLIVRRGEPFWIMPTLVATITAAMVPILSESTAFPPRGAEEWLPFVAVGAGALELFTRGTQLPVWLRWLLRTLLLAAIAAACAQNMVRGPWTPATSAMWIGGFTLITLAASFVQERVQARTRGITAPALLLIVVGGASQIVAVGYSSLKLGQSIGVVASILGAACVVAILRPRFSLAFGGVFVPVVILAAGVLIGDITTNTRHALYTSMIVAAAVLPGLTLLGPLARVRGWKRSILLFALAGLPIALALAVAGMDELNREKSDYDDASAITVSARVSAALVFESVPAR